MNGFRNQGALTLITRINASVLLRSTPQTGRPTKKVAGGGSITACSR